VTFHDTPREGDALFYQAIENTCTAANSCDIRAARDEKIDPSSVEYIQQLSCTLIGSIFWLMWLVCRWFMGYGIKISFFRPPQGRQADRLV